MPVQDWSSGRLAIRSMTPLLRRIRHWNLRSHVPWSHRQPRRCRRCKVANVPKVHWDWRCLPRMGKILQMVTDLSQELACTLLGFAALLKVLAIQSNQINPNQRFPSKPVKGIETGSAWRKAKLDIAQAHSNTLHWSYFTHMKVSATEVRKDRGVGPRT